MILFIFSKATRMKHLIIILLICLPTINILSQKKDYNVNDGNTINICKNKIKELYDLCNELNEKKMKEYRISKNHKKNNMKKLILLGKQIIANSPSLWPVKGYIVSRYKKRNSTSKNKITIRDGIVIASLQGSPVRSTANGIVLSVENHTLLGLTIEIKHKYGFITSYSHCSSIFVKKGQRVKRGERIGCVGKTGIATQYCCYYRIRINNQYIDPVPFLYKKDLVK